jgi:hypothetical protein
MTLPSQTPRPVDAGVLWAGGVAAAVVAALIVIVGILFCRGVLDIPILAPKGEGVWGDADTITYSAGAAIAALLATGVMHLLLLSTPKAGMFFAWIISLATLAAMVAPFAVKASQESQIATAALNFVLGIAIGSLVSGSARSAVRKASFRTRPPLSGPPYPTR